MPISPGKEALSAISEYQHIQLTPISPHTGVAIAGVDLAAPSAAAIKEIRQAFSEHSLLVFRDQTIDAEQHKAFGRKFGKLHIHPSKSHLGVKGDAELFTINTKPDSNYSNGEHWHSDVSCDPLPPQASMLYVQEVPTETGGDTMFANMMVAFDALSPPLQKMLLKLQAVHDGMKDLATYNFELKPGQSYPRAVHPLNTKHPESGKPILFVNSSFTTHIQDLPRSESDALLDLLYHHIERNPRWHCRVRWQPGTLTVWDNRCLQHHAIWDYFPHSRSARRVTVQCATPPVAYGAH